LLNMVAAALAWLNTIVAFVCFALIPLLYIALLLREAGRTTLRYAGAPPANFKATGTGCLLLVQQGQEPAAKSATNRCPR
jgi:hypothetical protein